MQSVILIADDAELIRTSLDSLFKREGFHTRLAPDGFIAVTIVKRESIDLAILDIDMPGMGGLEAIREIKVVRPELPVIATTGFVTKEIMMQILEEGAYSFFAKPLDVDVLINQVHDILGI